MTAVEAQAIARVADDFRRRGYTVDVEPGPGVLPDFLSDLQPDLIARRPGDSVVVEVKVGTRTSVAERLREIADRVNREPGWRFSLVFAGADEPGQIVDAQLAPLSVLERRMRDVLSLLDSRQKEAAFLLLWSALEGGLRLLGERAGIPLGNLPPSALMRELYSSGELGREPFETLMRLLPVRNQLIHGFEPLRGEEAEQLHAVVAPIVEELRHGSD